MEWSDGILQITFSTDGGPLALNELSRTSPADLENRVVIMTGTGHGGLPGQPTPAREEESPLPWSSQSPIARTP